MTRHIIWMNYHTSFGNWTINSFTTEETINCWSVSYIVHRISVCVNYSSILSLSARFQKIFKPFSSANVLILCTNCVIGLDLSWSHYPISISSRKVSEDLSKYFLSFGPIFELRVAKARLPVEFPRFVWMYFLFCKPWIERAMYVLPKTLLLYCSINCCVR